MRQLKNRLALLSLAMICALSMSAYKYNYTTVADDPMHALIYTLPNGLKIYMSVSTDEPRIQTYIPVRVGGKNDPAETTGLAHYFEHLMFKGTKNFGTLNYEKEKPLLDEIERLFEVYRKTTDEAQRKAIYHQIDSISYEASKYAIPNEYDKLMAAIGAKGTNAFTTYDQTCYIENIPSNQIDTWAQIQADRIENPVIRGFHTELETIYEEKNMSLTKDMRKLYEKLWQVLTPNHPYGTQTVLGTQEHLKNPSITNVKNYHKQWYVPNNMAICVAGNFDPDNMVDIITKYFGHLKPNANLPKLNFKPEIEITSPISCEVLGLEAEQIVIAWRVPGESNQESEILDLLNEVLNNGKTGLFDINISQKQKVLGAGAGTYGQTDYSAQLLIGRPNAGQTLDDVKAILLEEIANLRNGNFDESLLTAIVNNYKLEQQKAIESNETRARAFASSFIANHDWADDAHTLERLSKITKKDVVDFANKYLRDDNYAVIYKRQGTDPKELKIAKPQLTPIVMNRDSSSAFLRQIQAKSVEPIEPAFIDYNKDITKLTTKRKIPVLYSQNTTNDIFTLIYKFEVGSAHNRKLDTAADLFEYLGTKDMTAEQIKSELYALACDFSISIGEERSYISISGLSENMNKAIAIVENLLLNAVPDKDAYANLASRLIKARNDAKHNQSANFSALRAYAMYGEKNSMRDHLSEKELMELNPEELTNTIADLCNYEHTIMYYGPESEKSLLKSLNSLHYTAKKLTAAPGESPYKRQLTNNTIIYIAPYKAKQVYMGMFSNDGSKFDKANDPEMTLYNGYFNGDMSSIVFQEMRESRSLAYSAAAQMVRPSKLKNSEVYVTMIATQNDKLIDAINAFNEIINNMPESESAFALTKKGIESRIRTNRVIKMNKIWAYINAQDLGLSEQLNKATFEKLPSLTLDDVKKYQQNKVKGRTFYYYILGDKDDLDIESLSKIGTIKYLTTEDIFGE